MILRRAFPPGFAATLAIAVVGGSLFALVGLPAGWLAGAMLAVTAASLAGIATRIPEWLRQAIFVLLGVQIGSAVSWDTIAQVSRWPLTMALMTMTVAGVTAASYLFYRRAAGWPPVAALLGGVPGAFSMVMALAEGHKADVASVAVVQCIRLFFLIAVLPLAMTAAGMHGPAAAGAAADMSLASLALVVAAGAAGGIAAHRLCVPAGLILGAAAASAGLELAGLADGAMPDLVLVPAFVVLGAMIGTRFAQFSLSRLRRLAGVGLLSFLLTFAVSAAGAFLASALAGIAPALTLIAFAPGGLETMTIMAFALGLDPAFVAAHQVGRYFLLSFAMPMAAAWAARLPAGPDSWTLQ